MPTASSSSSSMDHLLRCDLACPTCGGTTSASRAAFDLRGLICKTWCKLCRVSRPVCKWRCACGLRWHACPVHAAAPARLRAEAANAALVAVRKQATAPRARPPPTLTPAQRRLQAAPSVRGVKRISAWLDAPIPSQQAVALHQQPTVAFSHQEIQATRPLSATALGPKLRARFGHKVGDIGNLPATAASTVGEEDTATAAKV